MTQATAVDLDAQIKELEEQLIATREKIVTLRKQRSGETVKDYELTGKDGKKVKLSSLFGDKEDLIVVHNMGKGCRYCTLWADGFIGISKHLSNRAGFALVSNDKHDVMKEFTEGRGWTYTCLSGAESDFTNDMGYLHKGKPWPGVSTFKKDNSGKITRVAHTWFGPGDDFCSVWHFLDMLDKGANEWEPQYKYD